MNSKCQIIIASDEGHFSYLHRNISMDERGLWRVPPGSEKWGAMVKAGNKEAYKRTGDESSKLCDINLPESHNNSFANAQYI